ncbi:hypothetical protein KB206_01535 [Microvirga sp. STS02]|uniref:hypothetical protein n=1 Tax=Hymenobacter negativus TaxID=2795026 RepID=UPI0018DEB2BE|nr:MULTISPECIES: hypothetical protein [Bacteria]MBH8567548.1 hypothetical protein [Hymenobacter negativus]MBR7207280.1 hypothetical protein [Microvirga sp. STS02]
MSPITVYTSNPADQGLAGFALALSHNLQRPVHLRALTALPAPDLLRRQALRVEHAELLEAIALAEHFLGLYEQGERQPDAGHENGLRFDLEALRNRLRGVETVLGLHATGADNA